MSRLYRLMSCSGNILCFSFVILHLRATAQLSHHSTEKVTEQEWETSMVVYKQTEQHKVMRMDGAATAIANSETRLNHLRKFNASLIPAPRKSVKRMIFESGLDFAKDLFGKRENPPKTVDDGVDGDSAYMIQMHKTGCTGKWERSLVVYKQTEQHKVMRMDGAATAIANSETRLNHLRKFNASLIPAPRKSVNGMIFKSRLDFAKDLFRKRENPPKTVDDGVAVEGDVNMIQMHEPRCTGKMRRIFPNPLKPN